MANGTPEEAKLDFALSLASPLAGATPVTLATIVYETETGDHRVDVAFRLGSLELYENHNGVFENLARSGGSLPLDEFHQVSLVFTFTGPPKVVAKVDGIKHLDRPIKVLVPKAGKIELALGIYVAEPCSAVVARFDDVVYRLTTL